MSRHYTSEHHHISDSCRLHMVTDKETSDRAQSLHPYTYIHALPINETLRSGHMKKSETIYLHTFLLCKYFVTIQICFLPFSLN